MTGSDPRASAPFPVEHSVPSAAAVGARVAELYPIEAPTTCELLHRGVNDTYLLGTREGRWIARVYRADWRSEDDVQYEVDLLFHLDGDGVDVAVPARGNAGETVHALPLPEGERSLVVFEYAEGRPLSWTSPADGLAAGRLAAQIHAAAGDFDTMRPRAPLDLEHLIHGSLATALPYVTDAGQRNVLERFAAMLDEAALEAVSAGLDWGVCHGDFGASNIHISGDGSARVFDFDLCGPGWRVWDLVAAWSMSRYERDDAVWTSFVRGYRGEREIAAADLAAAPLFHAMSRLWSLGMRARNASYRGTWALDDAYLGRLMRFVRDWEAESAADATWSESVS